MSPRQQIKKFPIYILVGKIKSVTTELNEFENRYQSIIINFFDFSGYQSFIDRRKKNFSRINSAQMLSFRLRP